MYQVVLTLKSGAFLEGETRQPENLEEAKARLAAALEATNKVFSLTLADGSFAIVFTDNIEQVRLEKVAEVTVGAQS